MDHGSTHVMMNHSELKWMDPPPGLPSGSKVSVLSGDPSKEGPFTIRVMFPANYKVPPHTHPTVENVVVLEGSLFMGSGEQFAEDKATQLSVHGFSAIPANSPHYVFTKEKTMVQIHAIGPFSIKYVNPADDPRNK
jgi:quercetin dioxygenase-like cupin family protein